LVIVDKPAGMTSHDVVGAVRRLVGTRRVGHAGTLDPMATGVLVLGVERATKLLTQLTLTDKVYSATIRFGQASDTDDADGELGPISSTAALTQQRVVDAMSGFAGAIAQVPSDVSAIKVDGQRAYALVRAGETVDLAARPVTVSRFELVGEARRVDDFLDVDVLVECSTGTYVRALARDLGVLLGVGAHLTALRRTRVGPFTEDQAITLEELAAVQGQLPLPLPDAIAASMPTRRITPEQASELSYGRTIEPAGIAGQYGAIDEAGAAVALMVESGGRARPTLGFTPKG
jgi:tRNA pseudouridine55 synthase